MKEIVPRLKENATRIIRKGTLRRVGVAILAVAMFVDTTAALAMPALTMSKPTVCGVEEHSHSEICYAEHTVEGEYSLICNLETLGVHQHQDSRKTRKALGIG